MVQPLKGFTFVAVLSFWALRLPATCGAAPSASTTSARASGVSSGAPAASTNASQPASSASPTSSALSVVPSMPPLKPGQLPNSFPANSTIVSGTNFSTAWQEYFLVTQGLPNITFPLSNNYAGNLPNGPMLLHDDFTISQNPKSLTNLLDTFWVDQPVGSGFSTVDSDGYAKDENDVAADFLGFLENLVLVFPSLATRPLYLAGEDYAGIFIPYIAQALLAAQYPPVTVKKIAIGNGLMGGFSVYPNLATLSILESFPQLIKFDESTFEAFQSKEQLCGFNLNLTYPQQAPLSPIPPAPRRSALWSSAVPTESKLDGLLVKRQSSQTLSNTLDPFYECALFDEMIDYAGNFSFPWSAYDMKLFDVADVVTPQVSLDGGIYFNSDQVRTALHAPFSKNWTSVSEYPFGSTTNIFEKFRPSASRPFTFFNELVGSALAKDIDIILYSGANNAISNHRGLEILIQNTTFGGTQGFTRKPSTPWEDDNNEVAGIVHQERGITYALFDGVGGLTPFTTPTAAYTFYREFVVNSNTTGSLTVTANNAPAVLGGEDTARADDAPRVATALFLGASATQSTLFAPSATVAAWASFLASAGVAAPAVSATSAAMGRAGVAWACVAAAAAGLWFGL
ncbi:alpha/beta-hydrolase [Artomyces pyxidatus]|uniref:Alpha/beta-hydrolase n=1 Tax=Artomyces pyxidatus TaxID=48021 RepID=A0ACB8TER2_9AGAM|nr:alpha/beta-hydrolase [Artomyces pyxidatus]